MAKQDFWNAPAIRFLSNMMHFWLIAVLLIPFLLFAYFKSTLPVYSTEPPATQQYICEGSLPSNTSSDAPSTSGADESSESSTSAVLPITTYVGPKSPQTNAPSWEKVGLSHDAFEWIAIFSSVCAFGALGSMTSYYSRSPGKGTTSDKSLLSTQLSGMMFSIMLALIFIGGLVKGSLFPDFGINPRWSYFAFQFSDWAKLLVWSFISGFSERLVPDMLDNIVNRSRTDKPPTGSDTEGR